MRRGRSEREDLLEVLARAEAALLAAALPDRGQSYRALFDRAVRQGWDASRMAALTLAAGRLLSRGMLVETEERRIRGLRPGERPIPRREY